MRRSKQKCTGYYKLICKIVLRLWPMMRNIEVIQKINHFSTGKSEIQNGYGNKNTVKTNIDQHLVLNNFYTSTQFQIII